MQKLNPAVYYKKDMRIEIDGHKGYGTLVVQPLPEHRIKVKFGGKGDMVTLKTCHREEEMLDLGRRESFNFIPDEIMEQSGYCYLEIEAFDKEGRHSWGLVDFNNEKFQLPAHIRCNGSSYNSRGVTVCQSKEGLLQRIEFTEEVVMSSLAKCGTLPTEDGKVFVFNMPNRECTFIFKGTSGKMHKLLTIGYEEIIIRDL